MDFDGTLKPLDQPVHPLDLQVLKFLGDQGIYRVIATGRSINTFLKEWNPLISIDYLISSSGIATSKFSLEGHLEILQKSTFTASDADNALQIARELELSFCVSPPPPEAHLFYYLGPPHGELPFSFRARVRQYQGWAFPFSGDLHFPLGQILIIGSQENIQKAADLIRAKAPTLSFVTTFSPYGDPDFWLEIFPPGISKGNAAATLAQSLNLEPHDALALGNDFNDQALLEWAGLAFICPGAPNLLLEKFKNIPLGEPPLHYILHNYFKISLS
ncbi:MAG: HAD family hydrolase [Deltaproteobacteria bacterium]|jgi:hydroxymethylpyrimidine pyrophosphatase-like HAD family hydrolase|nr:HAD family hydrolase [Deltaproteobacteria bacterium]